MEKVKKWIVNAKIARRLKSISPKTFLGEIKVFTHLLYSLIIAELDKAKRFAFGLLFSGLSSILQMGLHLANTIWHFELKNCDCLLSHCAISELKTFFVCFFSFVSFCEKWLFFLLTNFGNIVIVNLVFTLGIRGPSNDLLRSLPFVLLFEPDKR